MAVCPEDFCINLIGMKFTNGTLYFTAEDNENLESDHFGKLLSRISILRNVENKVLIISQRNQLLFEDIPDTDLAANEPQTIFTISYYRDSLQRGRAATISVRHNGVLTLSCKDKVISFLNIDPPPDMDVEESDIIFFMKTATGFNNMMEFESSLYKGYFLACAEENGLFKLILKEKDKDSNIKSVIFTVEHTGEESM